MSVCELGAQRKTNRRVWYVCIYVCVHWDWGLGSAVARGMRQKQWHGNVLLLCVIAVFWIQQDAFLSFLLCINIFKQKRYVRAWSVKMSKVVHADWKNSCCCHLMNTFRNKCIKNIIILTCSKHSKFDFCCLVFKACNLCVLQDSAQEGVITRDIHRTFPAHDYFKDSDGDGQDSLYKICKVSYNIQIFEFHKISTGSYRTTQYLAFFHDITEQKANLDLQTFMLCLNIFENFPAENHHLLRCLLRQN